MSIPPKARPHTSGTGQGRSFGHLILAHGETKPDDVAFCLLGKKADSRREVTWGTMASRAGGLAGTLAARDLAGKPVAILCPNAEDFLIALATCFLSGAVAVPMPPVANRRSAGRMASIARAANPAGFLVGAGVAQLPWVAELLGESSAVIIEVGGNLDAPRLPFSLPAAHDAALVQFTSGSTGEPAGVLLTHANIAANCAAIATAYELDSSSVGLSWLPLHHDMGLVGHVLTNFVVGGRSCLMDALLFLQRPLLWLQRASEEKAVITSAPNFAFELCSRAAADADLSGIDLSHLSNAICGGEPVLMGTLERFAETFAPVGFRRSALAPSYGLAEATLLVSSGKTAAGPQVKLAAVPFGEAITETGPWTALGPPVDGVTVRILDPDSDAECADGHFGEIVISGPCVGRPFNAAASSETGGVRTGDLGFLSDGVLVVTGRKKDLIILKGQNLFPADVEWAALEASPLIEPGGVAAIGVAVDGSEALVLVAEVHKASAGNREFEELRRNLNQAITIATGHAPWEIVLVEFASLPRTPSGKVQRIKVRAQYLEAQLRSLEEATLSTLTV